MVMSRSKAAPAHHRLVVSVAVLAVIMGSLVANTGSAQAAADDCPQNYFCFWVDNDYGPSNAMGQTNVTLGALYHFDAAPCQTRSWMNCISSFRNRTDRTWRMSTCSTYYKGLYPEQCPIWDVTPGESWSSMLSGWNDAVNSLERL